MKIIKYILPFVLATALIGCSNLQDSLHDELVEEMKSETGRASVNGSNWYYNGASSSDMSKENEVLKVDFDRVVAETFEVNNDVYTSNTVAKFEISYKDSDGNSNVINKTLSKGDAGTLSNDGKTFYLSMKPVLELLDGATKTTQDNTAKVKIKLSGFVCNEGNQKGRSIEALETKLNVLPLFSSSTLESVSFGTLTSSLNKKIEIPTLSEKISLTNDAEIIVKDSSFENISGSNFDLSVVDSKILITPKVEFIKKEGSIDLTVNGFKTSNSAVSLSKTFKIELAASSLSTDSLNVSKTDNVNYSIESVNLKPYDSGLEITINSSDFLGGWENDRIAIYIDDLNLGSENTTYAASSNTNSKANPATNVSVNSSVEYTGIDIFAGWDDATGELKSYRTAKFTQNATNWVYYADTKSLTYKIPFDKITDGTDIAKISDSFAVVVVIGDGWNDGTNHAKNAVPSSAVTISKTDADGDTIAIDFTKALVLGESENVEITPNAPKYASVESVTSSTVSLYWSDVFNAESYKVYKKEKGGEFDEGTEFTTTSATISDLKSETEYVFKIVSVNGEKVSEGKEVSVTTTPELPESFTISASAGTFDVDGTTVTISDIDSNKAESYKVFYKKTTEKDYTESNATVSDKTATLTLDMGYYDIKVEATNSVGSTDSTTTVKVYPTIELNGELENAYTNEKCGSSSSDSWGTLSGLYVTNDSENLYVAFESSSVVSSWKNDARFTILIGDKNATGGTSSINYEWGKAAPATTTTITNGYVKFIVSETSAGTLTDDSVSTSVTWNGDGEDSAFTASSSVVEFKIPLESVGSIGDELKIFGSWSDYNYKTEHGNFTYIVDAIPTTNVLTTEGSVDMEKDWTIENLNATVDMSNALSYTIK